MQDFYDKSVIITGGSSGIGKALAREIFLLGGSVTLCARDINKLEKTKEELIPLRTNPNAKITLIAIDITDFEQVNQLMSNYLSVSGAPDMLINCAGVAHPGEFLDLDLDIFHWLMDTNYFGTVHMTKSILPGMIASGHGYLVNISSAAGFLGVYGYTAYGATKYAVRGFSDALRSEVKLKNVKMSLVFPPDTDTPQLEYEAQFKPAITKALAGNVGVLSAEKVAKSILKGVAKEKYIITPGLENAFLYHMSNFLGNKIYWIMDLMVKSAYLKSKQ